MVKVEWADRYFPGVPIILAKEKQLCAGPKTILIDDYDKNVRLFKKAGGEAFYWPNGYSLMEGEINLSNTIKGLENQIRSINTNL